jgi:hypothetical protein
MKLTFKEPRKPRYEYEFAFLSDGSQREDVCYFDLKAGLGDAIQTYLETGRGCVLVYLLDNLEGSREVYEIDEELPHRYAEKIVLRFVKETNYFK